MFSFLGLRSKESKKSSDREADGGFVIVGETLEEQRRKIQNMNTMQPCSSNVIVLPNKSPYATPSRPAPAAPITTTVLLQAPPPLVAPAQDPPGGLLLPDLLGDVPFGLAPHVLAVQVGFPLGVPDVLLSRDINHNLSSFHYDFTLENSVLCNQ